MSYQVLWHADAIRDLKRVDKKQADEIFNKTETYLSKDPLKFGKPLKGHLKGFYRYRAGKFRIIYLIKQKQVLVIVLRVGKRDEIYKNKL